MTEEKYSYCLSSANYMSDIVYAFIFLRLILIVIL